MTINLYCKPYLRAEAQRKLADGTFEKMVLDHIAQHDESPTNTYNLRYHGDGTTVTIWKAQ